MFQMYLGQATVIIASDEVFSSTNRSRWYSHALAFRNRLAIGLPWFPSDMHEFTQIEHFM